MPCESSRIAGASRSASRRDSRSRRRRATDAAIRTRTASSIGLVGFFLELGKQGERLQRRELVDVERAKPATQLIVGGIGRLEQPELRLARGCRCRSATGGRHATARRARAPPGSLAPARRRRAAGRRGARPGCRSCDRRGPARPCAGRTMSSFHSRTTTWKLTTLGQRVGEIGQLVVVRGEHRLGPRRGFDARCSATAHARLEPVEGRGAAADLVEDHEAAGRRRVQDVRRLLHLDHERRLAARDVVGRADAREDAIDDRQLRARAPARTSPPAPSGRAARTAGGRWTCRPCSGRSG